jgi:hypothetical protein
MKRRAEEESGYDDFNALLNLKSEENTIKSQQVKAAKIKVKECKAACPDNSPFHSLSYEFIARMEDEMRIIDSARDNVAEAVDRGLQYYWNHNPSIDDQNILISNMQEVIDFSNATLDRLNAQVTELCGIINSINSNRAPIVGIAIDPNDHSGNS